MAAAVADNSSTLEDSHSAKAVVVLYNQYPFYILKRPFPILPGLQLYRHALSPSSTDM